MVMMSLLPSPTTLSFFWLFRRGGRFHVKSFLTACTSQYVEVVGHLHEDRKVEEFKSTDFGDSFGETITSVGYAQHS